MVKLNLNIKDPIITITVGTIITFALMILIDNLESYLWVWDYAIPMGTVISGLIGGFVATYFAKDKKIRYGIYEGILAVLVNITYAYLADFPEMSFGLIVFTALIFIFLLILPAIIGGYFGKTLYNHFKQNTEKTAA